MADLLRVRMSYDEWWALPEKPKSEWVDGEVVIMNTPPTFDHGSAQVDLAGVLKQAFPHLRTVTEVPVQLPNNRVRLPDITLVEARPVGALITDPPELVVEILSPSTRGEDTVRKSGEYAAGGIGQYWIVDPELRTLDVYELVDGGWAPRLHLDGEHPVGTVEVGEHGPVGLDLAEILRR